MRDGTAKHLSTLHTLLYRASSGVVGRRLVNNDMLLITTTGRRTGRPHTVPLLYLTDPEGWLVIASWGGRDRHPEWYLNLQAEPRARIQIRRDRHQVVAATVDHDWRRALWPRIVSAYDGYAEYQARTDRQIPVVLLQPAT
jgi:deazaflavin-dependent oxidoreductase (nitroreductase family)